MDRSCNDILPDGRVLHHVVRTMERKAGSLVRVVDGDRRKDETCMKSDH